MTNKEKWQLRRKVDWLDHIDNIEVFNRVGRKKMDELVAAGKTDEAIAVSKRVTEEIYYFIDKAYKDAKERIEDDAGKIN